MIDPPCREAGEIMQRADPADSETYELARAAAKAMHGKCRGSTWCECQHVLPEPPRRQDVTGLDAT